MKVYRAKRALPRGRWRESVRDRFLGWLLDAGIQLHEGQRWLLERRYKEKYIIAGRRYGKSEYLAVEIIAHLVEMRMMGIEPKIRLVAPRHDQIRATVDALERDARMLGLSWEDKTRDTTDPRVIVDGVEIALRVANSQEAHRSAHATLLCLDEVRDIHENVFREAMRAMLLDYDGHVVFATSARGWSWFVHRAMEKGIRVKEEGFMWGENEIYRDEVPNEVAWLQAPSWMNPFIPKKDIYEMWKDEYRISPSIARQELGAAILRDYGHPFPHPPIYDAVNKADLNWRYGLWVIGADYGASAAMAAIWVCKGLNGKYYVDREVYVDNTTDSTQQMRLIAERGVTKDMWIIADKSIWNRDVRGPIVQHWRKAAREILGFEPRIVPATGEAKLRSVQQDPTRKPPGLRAHMLALLREKLAHEEIIINRDQCPNLVHEITNAQAVPGKYLDIAKPDHAIMALAYAIDFLDPIPTPKIRSFDDVGVRAWLEERLREESKPVEPDETAGRIFDWTPLRNAPESESIPYREPSANEIWID